MADVAGRGAARRFDRKDGVMVDIVGYAAIKRLLDAVERAVGKLRPNEIETYRELAAKYAGPAPPDANDATCLEVILRNVEIRKAYRVKPDSDRDRVIEPMIRRSSRRR